VRLLALLLIVGALVPSHSVSAETYVIDGDTIDVDGERIRLRSETGPIDAPELRRAKCPLELFRAEAARDRLRAIVASGDVEIERTDTDRYGRTVAIIRVGGRRGRPARPRGPCEDVAVAAGEGPTDVVLTRP
jgi:endonuclease YncB( thermonuclease family)